MQHRDKMFHPLLRLIGRTSDFALVFGFVFFVVLWLVSGFLLFVCVSCFFLILLVYLFMPIFSFALQWLL